MMSQWLEGLATLSEKGIHGDLSPGNLLFKRGGKENMEAVISDFGTFRPYGQEEYGLTTLIVCPPEYFREERVTSKQDVWALGISMHQIFAKQWLPCWAIKDEEMYLWTSTLRPGWILEQPTHSQTPQFLLDLINAMLDPRDVSRPCAKEAFEQFSKGLAAYAEAEIASTTEAV